MSKCKDCDYFLSKYQECEHPDVPQSRADFCLPESASCEYFEHNCGDKQILKEREKMLLCKECKKCGMCGKPYGQNSNYAEKCKDFEKKKMTKFERLKSLTLDEFVDEILLNVPDDNDTRFIFGSWKNKKEIISYLESEVE